jgi:CDP-glucose 4,6-dehydratase
VLEPLAGYIKLAELMTVNGPKYAEAWNFGPREEDARPVQWIVERMTEQWGGDASWRLNEDDHPYEANYLKLDCSKAYLKLNWSPKWDLNYSLEKINEWYKPKQIQENFRQATLRQIVEYMNTD